MKGKRSLALLLGMVLLCALLSGCAEEVAPSEAYGHLGDRYVIYDHIIYVVEGGEEPSPEFVEAREALIMARYDEAYAGFEALAGAADSDLERARCLNGMAVTQAIQSRYAACNELFEQALAIYGNLGEESRIEMALCMQNKAIMLYDQIMYDEAMAVMEQVMEVEKELDKMHPDKAVINLTNMNIVTYYFGRTSPAGPYQREAYSIMSKVFGENHLLTVVCEAADFKRFHVNGRNENNRTNMFLAKEAYTKELEVAKSELGEEHPLVGILYLKIAETNIDQLKFNAETLVYLKDAEKVLLPVYGENHIKMVDINTRRDTYYWHFEKYDTSLECRAKILHQLEQIQMYGLKDQNYAYALGDVANYYINTDQAEKAVDYIFRHIYILETYWDDYDNDKAKGTLKAIYDLYDLSDQPFEEWFDEQMAYHAAHEDEPMIVEGYEYLYE